MAMGFVTNYVSDRHSIIYSFSALFRERILWDED